MVVAQQSAAKAGLAAELNFRPQGLVSAKVTRFRNGLAVSFPLYEMAVSDRKFAAGDIDRLAADVAHGMKAADGGERG